MIREVLSRLREVSPTSRGWVARCPFHPDGGRRNLYVYADTESFYCYRCGAAGPISRLLGVQAPGRLPKPAPDPEPSPEVLAAVDLAARVYARDLDHPAAREYLEHRGIPQGLAEAFGLGWARGDRLLGEVLVRGLKAAAVRAGLLRPDGEETLRGRLIIPEWRGGRAVFLTGRAPAGPGPRYLSAAVPRRVFYLERAAACGKPPALVEGPFDALALWAAGIPAAALGGPPGRRLLKELRALRSPILIPDADPAGEELARKLAPLGVRRLRLPPGVKDPAELYRRDGPQALKALFENFDKEDKEDFVMTTRLSFVGNLGADPEFAYTAEGRPVLRFRAAMNFRPRGAENHETFWVSVVVFGPQAERLSARLQKGSRVFVEGRLELRRISRRDGSPDVGLDLVADRVLILERAPAPEEPEDDLPF